MPELKVLFQAKSNSVECNEGETLLECLLRHSIDVPYSCMDGVCGSCMAEKKLGEVEMKSDDFLSDSDKKRNMVLTCQATISKGCQSVEVDFDSV